MLTFTCLRCGRCCEASLFIPLTYEDFYDWYLSKCFLPILFTIKESNIYTEEAGIEWAYTLLSARHSIYTTVKGILEKYNVKMREKGCSMLNNMYNYCRIYRKRPLACRLFPFDNNLRVVDWALENCEAIKKGLVRPPPNYVIIAQKYSEAIERTYSNKNVLDKIENIRKIVFDKVMRKIVTNRYDLETLRYLLFKIVEYG
ncbi:MAG: YkgJ family cysteine cluster protein [Crenarchaeota archaeon]|nr:YkgJ family cysteine cluster protein [Thermoproteota archaeon]